MTVHLHDTAPGFDQPIAVLKHCHDRIRKQLATLDKLLAHLPQHGADPAAQQAAIAVMRYFDTAAHLHHADEEDNLLPMLQGCAAGADAALLAEHVPRILADHDRMDAAWQRLHEQLSAVAAGKSAQLAAAEVRAFADSYAQHMLVEETHIAPMARRLFTPEQMQALGQAMQLRRGISAAPAPGALDSSAALAQMRRDYGQASLSEADVLDDPVAQFQRWFDEALKAEVKEPNAMSVATVGADGKPSSRIVLVKQYDQRGFTWYTNYDSQKGRQLCANPHAALLFFWSELERQVRIEGRVERTSDEESDRYFHSRPLKSRLAAVASAQSRPVGSRADLEQQYAQVEAEFGDNPPRPAHWGGYRLVPERIEFWQGRRSRFHDRIVYVRAADGGWQRQRLQP
jgi:pyridoxamine 5'-phosphate oxidase